MVTPVKCSVWRRSFSALLEVFAASVFFDCIMMFIEEFPKRSFDPSQGHWWSHFLISFGATFSFGSVVLWGALRLWRRLPLDV